MNKLKLLGISTILSTVFMVSGCSDEQQPVTGSDTTIQNKRNTSNLVIGFAHCCVRGEISTMDSVEDVIKLSAAKSGVKLLFENAEETKHLIKGEDGNDTEMDDYYTIQPAQVKKMIDEGAKAIILITVQGKEEEKMQAEILEYAREKGISVVAVRRPLKISTHMQYGNAYSVGSSSEIVPVLQSKMVVDQWKKHPEWDKNGDGKIQYGLIRGKKGSTNDNYRKLTPNKINNLGVETQWIAQGIANWNREEGKALVEGWIQSGDVDKMEIIISGSDDMALGALDALREAKKTVPPIFGFNATKEAKEAIKTGEFGGSLLRDFTGHGKVAYKMAENLASGKSVMDDIDAQLEGGNTVNLSYEIVTQDNVDEYLKK